MRSKLTLWRLTWSHACGTYWQAQRACDDSTAESWLEIYRRDEPNATYSLARRAPRIVTGYESRALHPATFR
jgi:hypothetical protein